MAAFYQPLTDISSFANTSLGDFTNGGRNFINLFVLGVFIRKKCFKYIGPLKFALRYVIGHPYSAKVTIAPFYTQQSSQIPYPYPCLCPCPCPCPCRCSCPCLCPCLCPSPCMCPFQCQFKKGAMSISVRHGNNSVFDSQGP